MRLRIKHIFALLLTIAAVSAAQAVAQSAAQPAPTSGSANKPFRAELELGYSAPGRLRLLQPQRRQRHLCLAS
jgi:putative salt-induced outer membrane protein YdiY